MDEQINNIMRLARAITATGKYHCFVDYSGHVEWLDVRVFPGDSDYQDENKRPVHVMKRSVTLNRPAAVHQLYELAQEMGNLLRDATIEPGTIRVQMPRMQA